MDYEEIEACVAGAKQGSHQDMMKILKQYKPYIYKAAMRYRLKNYELEDLVQICYASLINSVSKYRTGSSTFSSYAYNTVNNALKYTARQNIRHGEVLSLNTKIDAEDNSKAEYIDCLQSDDNLEEKVMNSERKREINDALLRLPSDEISLVNMIFYDQHSIKDYAEKNDMPYLRAVRKKNRVLKKLNSRLLN